MKLLLLLVTVLISSSGKAEELPEEDKSSIVLLHNEIRRSVVPPSTYMHDLEWDEDLAVSANQYASTCSTINPLYSDEEVVYDGFGANVGVANGPSYDVLEMVGVWGGQSAHYNYSCNSCNIGRCKRYKQLVYDEAESVGCAVQDCKSVAENTEQDHPIILVCLYDKKFSSNSRPYNSLLDVCIACPEQEDCMTPTKPDDDEDEGKVQDDLYVADKDKIEECPPVCTTDYCLSDKKKLFNKACSLPADPDCTISSCKACYFSKRKRVLPEGCEDQICPDWHDKSCLYKWARCIEDVDTQPEEKKLKKFFKCYEPPPY